jgi:lantibiotic modifying enzyme
MIRNTIGEEPIFDKIHQIKDVLMNSNIKQNISLMGGNGGVILFLAYYSDYFNDSDTKQRYHLMIEQNNQRIQDNELPLTFSNGIIGYCWLLQHLSNNGFIDQIEIDDDFENQLTRFSLLELKKLLWDYLHGGLGILSYFSEKMNLTESNKKLLLSS